MLMIRLCGDPVHSSVRDFVKKLLVASALLAAVAYAVAQDTAKVNLQITRAEYDALLDRAFGLLEITAAGTFAAPAEGYVDFQLTQAEYDTLLEKAAAGDAVAQFSLGVLHGGCSTDGDYHLDTPADEDQFFYSFAATRYHMGGYYLDASNDLPEGIGLRRLLEKEPPPEEKDLWYFRNQWRKVWLPAPDDITTFFYSEIETEFMLSVFEPHKRLIELEGVKVRQWFEEAAEQGHAGAQLWMAYADSTIDDYKAAAEWLRKAAEQGHVTALMWGANELMMGSFVLDDVDHHDQSSEYVAKVRRRRAESEPLAMELLAQEGIRAKADADERAKEWLHKVIEHGHHFGASLMLESWYVGEGEDALDEGDFDAAISYHRKAIEWAINRLERGSAQVGPARFNLERLEELEERLGQRLEFLEKQRQRGDYDRNHEIAPVREYVGMLRGHKAELQRLESLVLDAGDVFVVYDSDDADDFVREACRRASAVDCPEFHRARAREEYNENLMLNLNVEYPDGPIDCCLPILELAAMQGDAVAQKLFASWEYPLSYFTSLHRLSREGLCTSLIWYRRWEASNENATERNTRPAAEIWHRGWEATNEKTTERNARLAAEQGHTDAQHSLGGMRKNGRGVAKDDVDVAANEKAEAEKRAAEQAARLATEQAEKQAAEQAEKQAAEQAEKLAAEQAEKQADDERVARLAAELAARLVAEQAEKQAAEQAARLAEEQAARQAAERDARLAAEQAAEQAARLAEEQAARQAAERDARLAEEQAAELASTQWFQWLHNAAEQGDAVRQHELGAMYEHGRGVDEDHGKAVEWYLRAAEQGNTDAQGQLGRMYENGRGVARNHIKAVEWYRKAAVRGNADAQHNLGMMYSNGRGVAEDHGRAAEWYRKAAEQGNADAQGKLGRMYEKGRGVKRDNGRAVEWYRKAAEQGNGYAQKELGRMYAKGQGVKRDDVTALMWHILSRDQMEPSSREDRLRKGLSDRKEAEAEQRAEACRARQYQDC